MQPISQHNNKNEQKKSNAKSKLVLITLHIAIWGLLFIIPHIIIHLYWGNTKFVPFSFYINAALYGIIFYINYLWLVPKFFFRSKNFTYFGLATMVIVIMYTINFNIEKFFKPPNAANIEGMEYPGEKPSIPPYELPTPPDASNNKPKPAESPQKPEVMPQPPMRGMNEPDPFERKGPPFEQMQLYFFALISVIITGFSVGLKVIDKHTASEKRQRELEKEKLNSELAFLKNQISPHFFFNTLNNIYSLVEINKDDAQGAILKLSKLMRYLLYESEVKETYLSNEIDFMNHYINLMQLRLSTKVEIDIQMPNKNIDYKVPPLLFIPFIENAFKYGVSYREKSFIRLEMDIKDDKVYFSCSNSISATNNNAIEKSHSGIGLTNVKKRLQLLFPERHKLTITDTNHVFMVHLEIDLKQPE